MAETWRTWFLGLIAIGSLVTTLSRPALPQNLVYHQFADQRTWLGIPHAADVLTNLALLVPGLLGMALCLRNRIPGARWSWLSLFAGTTLVTFGSGFYHWNPENWTLLWDRLPMTISFMGLFSILLCEYVFAESAERKLLPPLLFAGLASVVYWYAVDDLRIYLWVQFFPLVCIPLIALLFPARFSHQWLLFLALGLYALAKVTESHDLAIFQATGSVMSGHSLKHLLAGIANYALYRQARDRRPFQNPQEA